MHAHRPRLGKSRNFFPIHVNAISLIRHSFQKAAQTLPSTLDKKLSLYQYIDDYSLEEIAAMRSAFPYHVEIMRLKGKLTEADMDASDVPASRNNDKRRIPKDERVLHQQRSCILNGEDVKGQYHRNLEAKRLKAMEAQAKMRARRKRKAGDEENLEEIS